jgi:Ca2+-binding RTX toxin-like protein
VFVYGAGATSLVVDDRGDPTGRAATLSDGMITGLTPAPATIGWTPTSSATGGVTDLTVFGGSGGNTFTVTDTSNFYYSTSLRTGTGNDTVNVEGTTGALRVFNPGGQDSVYVGSNGSAPGGNVQGINGAVIVSSFGGGPTSLVVDDSGDTQPQSATLSNGALTGLAPATISYGSGVTALTVNGSQGASTYTVPSTRPGTATTVNAGAANDSFQVGGATHALSGLQGALTLNGGPGTNTVTFTDTAQSGKESYSLSTTALTGGGMAGVTFTGLQGLTFNAGTGAVSLAVTAVSPSLPVTYAGGGGSDTLQGPDGANTWQITAANAGTLDQIVSFSAVQNLAGGAGGDTFKFQTGGSLAGTLNGGGGTNTLDYSGYAGNILVDLPLALATAVAGGISNIQNVTGSQGDGLIVGDANPNVLVGGTGRNVIIGGAGADTITGGGGFNLLIGGTTSYDSNLPALQALMQYWDDPAATSLDQLVNPLKRKNGVTVNGQLLVLDQTTVQTDNAADSLIGGGGPNWFIRDKDGDTINNGNGPGPNDRLTVI